MIQIKQWGQFFPPYLSPFGYNETLAHDYYPLDEQTARQYSFHWRDEQNQASYQGTMFQVPDNINQVSDEICQQILKCEISGKLYKILPQELAFYRKMKVPIPKLCPDQRHRQRMKLRNPRKLYKRTCPITGEQMLSTYSLNRSEKVYSQKAYLEAVHG